MVDQSQIKALRSAGFGQMHESQKDAPSPSDRLKFASINFVFITVGIVFGAFCAWLVLQRPIDSPIERPIDSEPTVQPGAATTILPSDFQIIEASGFVVAAREATVSSEEIGRITSIYVRQGQMVNKGQPVAKLDDSRQISELVTAQQRAALAKARTLENDVALTATNPRLYRITELTARGFAPKGQLADIEAERERLAAGIKTAQHALTVSKTEVEQARIKLRKRIIYAPFTGQVSQINAQIGEVVSPISSGAAFIRTGICTLVDLSRIFAELQIDESLVGALHKVDKVELAIPALTQKLTGDLVPGSISVDNSRGTIVFRVEIRNPPSILLPGMQISARLSVKTKGIL